MPDEGGRDGASAERDPRISVEPVRLAVEPGGQARTTVTVTNPGTIVEGYALTVLGDLVAGWAEVTPPVLNVFPGKSETAVVVISPPAGPAALSGTVPFGVLARSSVDASCSAAAEGDLEVGRVPGLSASLRPTTSSGRWSGRHSVQVTNRGNAPAVLQVGASDPDDRLGFLVHPPRLEVPVGGVGHAAVRVRSRRPFLRGPDVRLPFQVVLDPAAAGPDGALPTGPPRPGDPTRPVLDGALAQRAVLTRSTVALGALAVLALAGAGVAVAQYERPPAPALRLDGALPVPPAPRIAAMTPTSMDVEWEPTGAVPDTWQVLRVVPETLQDTPPSTEAEEEVPGSRRGFSADSLDPATRYCFQLVAVKGGSRSTSSPAVCESTAAAPPPAETTPPAGTTPSAQTTPPAETTPPVPSEAQSPSSGSSSEPGSPGSTTSTPTTAPPVPPPAVTPTEPEVDPDPESTDTGPTLGDEEFVAVVHLMPGSEPEVMRQSNIADLEQTVADVDGATVGTLEVADHPALEDLQEDTVLIYIDRDFTSADEVAALCTELDLAVCLPRQPGPVREG